MSVQFDSIRIRNRIRESLAKAYTEIDPVLLNRYRSLFKQEVSLFKRSYFAAYILMELDQRDSGRRYHESRRRRGEEGSRPARENYPLAEEESVRLFISAGRSRRVFPREILGLILSKTSVSKDDIGAIRILDNYSFVQVRTTIADLIIEALNGKPFRGRTLSVNYARDRKDPAESCGPDCPCSHEEDIPPEDSCCAEAEFCREKSLKDFPQEDSEPEYSAEDKDDKENI